MKSVNLLEFISNAESLRALDYATLNDELVNFLNIFTEAENYTQKIDLGIVFVSQTELHKYIVVDGLSRLLSVSLLLHAICECYKKTSEKNDSAIKTIRRKYLLTKNKTKLNLPENIHEIYRKILFAEKLSGREKESSIFKLLHNFWQTIKNNKLQAAEIFKMLNKVVIMVDDIDDVHPIDLYLQINKNNRNINQLLLIKDYLKSLKIANLWDDFCSVFNGNEFDIHLFFKDFFVTKFNYKEYKENRTYEMFQNYFQTMMKYSSAKSIAEKLIHSAKLYNKILYADFKSGAVKDLMVKIKLHKGEDTYAYLLLICEDYENGVLTEPIFCEILLTIDEYLMNRLKNPNALSFNDLINYLNAFISCK